MRALPSFTAARSLPRADMVPILVPVRGSLRVESIVRTNLGSPCRTDQPDTCVGSTCTDDIWNGADENAGVCCLPGQVACAGICRDPCPNPRHVYEPFTCTCVCPNSYPDPCGGPPWVLSQITCLCECDLTAPCPIVGQIRDPVSCNCVCPPGQIPCQGVCIDPLTDTTFCGGCPGAVCNPFDQLCCNGVCTNIGTDANCRDCFDQVPAGWRCCNFTPTQLGTTQNCAGCGDTCTGGRQCINGQCQCPSGTRPCGGQCWPNSQLCCQNTGCPPNATDCCPGCQDFMTLPAQQPAWLAWRQAHPGEKIASCPDGTAASFACNPTLATIRDAQGQIWCCPPGCTGIDPTTELCTGCP